MLFGTLLGCCLPAVQPAVPFAKPAALLPPALRRVCFRFLTSPCSNCPETIEAVYLFRGAESTAWEADVRFVSAQDAARVLRFKLGLQVRFRPRLVADFRLSRAARDVGRSFSVVRGNAHQACGPDCAPSPPQPHPRCHCSCCPDRPSSLLARPAADALTAVLPACLPLPYPLQMHGSPVTLRPDPDEVKYERHKLWRLKQTQMWVDDAIRTVVAAGDAALLARLQALKGL